jgi:hypothetical protein
MVAEDTVEDKVVEIQTKKQALISQVRLIFHSYATRSRTNDCGLPGLLRKQESRRIRCQAWFVPSTRPSSSIR